jgi:hypothetical protein
VEYTLRFDCGKIDELASRYTLNQKQKEKEAEAHIERIVGPAAQRRGWYTRTEFLDLCEWKTPRTKERCARNEENYIIEVTMLALKTESERLRIEVLTLLYGVGWPTASVLLHFGHLERYPILDFRALWSLTIAQPKGDYNFSFWWDYVYACRKIATECGVAMRTLDRALWQYSAENQPRN